MIQIAIYSLRRSDKTLSILDLSGFEKLSKNKFDQLCINAANERLHTYLCRHIFNLERSDLDTEGISVDDVIFQDNQPLVDLLFEVNISLITHS